jgi:hypothetical protein
MAHQRQLGRSCVPPGTKKLSQRGNAEPSAHQVRRIASDDATARRRVPDVGAPPLSLPAPSHHGSSPDLGVHRPQFRWATVSGKDREDC